VRAASAGAKRVVRRRALLDFVRPVLCQFPFLFSHYRGEADLRGQISPLGLFVGWWWWWWIGLDWIGLDWIDWIGLDWERRGGEEGFFFRR